MSDTLNLSPSTGMKLSEFIREHYMLQRHGRNKRAPGKWVLRTARMLTRKLLIALERSPRVRDLNERTLLILEEQLKATCSPHKANDSRDLFMALWRFASDQGIVALPDKFKRGGSYATRMEMDDSEGTLWRFALEYFKRQLPPLSPKTIHQYGIAIRHFTAFLGHAPTAADLTDDALVYWVNHILQDKRLAVNTARERMGRILTLWNWMARRGYVATFPTQKRPPAPENTPIALDEAQLRRLFDEATREHGHIAGIPARHWWVTFLAFVFSTSERKSASLALRWEWIDFARGVVVIPPEVRKGSRKAGRYTLWPEVAALLASIREPSRELVFPWPYDDATYFNRFGRMMRRAGLPDDRRHKTHSLRVSHATWRKVMGGDPTKQLGHSDAATTAKSYLDPRFLQVDDVRLFVPWGAQQPLPPLVTEKTADIGMLEWLG